MSEHLQTLYKNNMLTSERFEISCRLNIRKIRGITFHEIRTAVQDGKHQPSAINNTRPSHMYETGVLKSHTR